MFTFISTTKTSILQSFTVSHRKPSLPPLLPLPHPAHFHRPNRTARPARFPPSQSAVAVPPELQISCTCRCLPSSTPRSRSGRRAAANPATPLRRAPLPSLAARVRALGRRQHRLEASSPFLASPPPAAATATATTMTTIVRTSTARHLSSRTTTTSVPTC